MPTSAEPTPPPPPPPEEELVQEEARRALAEDVGEGDLSAALVPPQRRARARLLLREEAVLCGVPWFEAVFRLLDPGVRLRWRHAEGERVAAGSVLCELEGPARALLTGERTALNFLQTLSGTATLARRYAEAVAGTGATVLDTRKTVPGLRLAQKYAVRVGGCQNHRLGLHDAILVKENHLLATGSLEAACREALALGAELGVPVEVEVEDLGQLRTALAAGVRRVLLDNFGLEALREAVALARALPGGPVELEASGGIDLGNVRRVAETGVDYVSVGALTKDVRAVDLSLRFLPSGDAPG